MTTLNPRILVGLDGTLSYQSEDPDDGQIGGPVPAMIDRVRRWLAEGRAVLVFTNRAATLSGMFAVRTWLDSHDLQAVGVTDRITHQTVELWWNSAVGVMPNKGVDRETLLQWHLLRVLEAAGLKVTTGVSYAIAADKGAAIIKGILEAHENALADLDGALSALSLVGKPGSNDDDNARNVRHAISSLGKAIKAIRREK